MDTILKRLRSLKPRDLHRLSNAVDAELQQRVAARNAAVPDDLHVIGDLQSATSPALLPIAAASRSGSSGPRRAA
jgi:hypothetical protein